MRFTKKCVLDLEFFQCLLANFNMHVKCWCLTPDVGDVSSNLRAVCFIVASFRDPYHVVASLWIRFKLLCHSCVLTSFSKYILFQTIVVLFSIQMRAIAWHIHLFFKEYLELSINTTFRIESYYVVTKFPDITVVGAFSNCLVYWAVRLCKYWIMVLLICLPLL